MQQFPRKSLKLKFMTTILTTLLNGFWIFVRRSPRSEHPLHVPQKHQTLIIPINNTIGMILHNNLTLIVMLLWKLKCTTMRTMPWKGSVRIVPCGLNSLSTGRVFWQTTPTIPIRKNSINNCKPFIGDSYKLTSSIGFDNQRLQNEKGLIPYILFQTDILHVQNLDPSGNLCFWQ